MSCTFLIRGKPLRTRLESRDRSDKVALTLPSPGHCHAPTSARPIRAHPQRNKPHDGPSMHHVRPRFCSSLKSRHDGQCALVDAQSHAGQGGKGSPEAPFHDTSGSSLSYSRRP